MKKYNILIDDTHDDFGFSAVSEDELKANENKLKEHLSIKSSELQNVSNTYEQKLEALYKQIMPLLINLQKNPDKEYVFWPHRAEKIKEFIKKIDDIVND